MKNQQTVLSNLKQLWRFLSPLHMRGFLCISIVFLIEIMGVLQPFFWKELIDKMVEKSPLSSLFYILVGLGIFKIVQEILVYLNQRFSLTYRWRTRILIEQAGLEKMLLFSIGQHQQKSSGIKFSAYQQGVGAFANLIPQLLFTILPSIFSIIAVLAFLLYLSWELGILLTLLIALYSASELLYIKIRLRPLLKEMTTRIQKRWGHLAERMREVEMVKQFGKESAEREWYIKDVTALSNFSYHIWLPTFFIQRIRGIILHICYFSILFLGAYFISTGRFSPGFFLLFLTWGNKTLDSVRTLVNIQQDFFDNLTTAERLLEILRVPADIVDPIAPTVPNETQGKITFQNISFSYTSQKLLGAKEKTFTTPLFDTLSLHIEAGETVAFVGHSGSGKSTITRLLQRYYDVEKGAILIDNRDIRELPQAYLRSVIGVVPQDVRLLDGTLRENLLYGVLEPSNASEEKLMEAIKISCIDTFLDKLPDGLESTLGENGVKLSGGEKQRVGIARALVKDPKILILDEATSALDTENEHLIKEAIKKVSLHRTTIIIAHRLSTIIHAEKVVVFEKGSIVGIGSHKELLHSCPAYHKLVHAQTEMLAL